MSIGDGYGEGREHRDTAEAGRTGTRIRLPEGESAASARGPAVRPGRSLLAVVGVVVLLIAAIAFATRGGGGAEDDAESREARPTAPTGVAPVEAGDGIPSGFPRTEQGAQSAAANYAVALVSADIIRPGERPRIIETVFVPEQADAMRQKLDDAYTTDFLEKVGLDADGDAPEGYTYVSRTVPVGTRLVSFAPDTAELAVWCTGVYGMAGPESRTPVRTDWFTMHLTLRWADGDWKVQSFAQESGPAPVNGDVRASGAEEIAEAVEGFGGFTYAR
ncbi:hypothetical protein V1J52_24910 [Streptomyces sp. TRM 70351]|uniref:hypothetical protein n=1 Tax=Streptomyces sp. TRM 70351 TaxID=3116552 RepID=UPI002E7BD2E2|nr:hypothetical protein [Streptomyces sp. TRM 70351]MEE1931363.1 hypothetical protein [Streptomyces sp. TRM 70351]